MAREPYPSQLQDRFIIRMPDGLRDKIKVVAAQNRRAMNSEIILRLEKSFGSEIADGVQP